MKNIILTLITLFTLVSCSKKTIEKKVVVEDNKYSIQYTIEGPNQEYLITTDGWQGWVGNGWSVTYQFHDYEYYYESIESKSGEVYSSTKSSPVWSYPNPPYTSIKGAYNFNVRLKIIGGKYDGQEQVVSGAFITLGRFKR